MNRFSKIKFLIIIDLIIAMAIGCVKDNPVVPKKLSIASTNLPLPFLYFDRDGNKELKYNEKNLLSEVVYDNYYIIKLNYDTKNRVVTELFYNANSAVWDTAKYKYDTNGLKIGRIHQLANDSLVYNTNGDLIKCIRYSTGHPPTFYDRGYVYIYTYEYDQNHNIIDWRWFNNINLANYDVIYPWKFTFRQIYKYDDKKNPLNLLGYPGNNLISTEFLSVNYQYDVDGFPASGIKTKIISYPQISVLDTVVSNYFVNYNTQPIY